MHCLLGLVFDCLQVITNRQPAPHGHCITHWGELWEAIGEYGKSVVLQLFAILGFEPPYTQEVFNQIKTGLIWSKCITLQHCLKNCLFLIFAKEANCTHIGVTPSPDVYAKLSGKRLCNMTEGGKSLICAHSNDTLWPLCMTQALTLRLLKGWWTNSKKELFLVPIAIRLAGSRPFLWQRPLLNGQLRSMRWMNILI